VLLHSLEAAAVRLRLSSSKHVPFVAELPGLTLPAEFHVAQAEIHSTKTVLHDGCQCNVAALVSDVIRATKPSHIARHFWEKVLLCQFHDVLPGSSIEMVHKDSKAIRSRCLNDLINLLQAVSVAASSVPCKIVSSVFTGSLSCVTSPDAVVPASGAFVVGWNHCPVARSEFVTVPLSWSPTPLQVTHDGQALIHVTAPAYGGVAVSAMDDTIGLGKVVVTEGGGKLPVACEPCGGGCTDGDPVCRRNYRGEFCDPRRCQPYQWKHHLVRCKLLVEVVSLRCLVLLDFLFKSVYQCDVQTWLRSRDPSWLRWKCHHPLR
jgi:hypothetical protein